jgi:hypothetical protein
MVVLYTVALWARLSFFSTGLTQLSERGGETVKGYTA